MNLSRPVPNIGALASKLARQRGSVLIIVLWIALGLIVITLYFANSMNLELRASDNRVAGIAADQAIDGAARYVSYVLATFATNGAVPDVSYYQSQAVSVGDAHFWIIGRPGDNVGQPDQLYFSLMDEGAKLNLNTVTAGMLLNLTNMTEELAANIRDWRDTNGNVSASGDGPTVYARRSPPYLPKNAAYETVDELKLVYGMDAATLFGEDANRNGVLDPNEEDQNRNGVVDPGLEEYFTVYSHEPNTRSDGTARVSVNRQVDVRSLFEQTFGRDRANQIQQTLRPSPNVPWPTFNSTLQFYLRSGMTLDEFGQVADAITASNASFIDGRVNVNTASAAVLACIPGIGADRAADLINYRQSNPDKLNSIAWVGDALNRNTTAVATAGPFLTTQSYQFTADVAALGPFGRGYRRTRFVFDTSEGAPKIIYRRDLSHLGWALGKPIRQVWLAAKEQP